MLRFARPETIALMMMASFAAVDGAQQIFRATVDHVSLDVIVTDKDEHPVVGLTRGDFEIREHDRVQTIDDFKYLAVPLRTEPVDLTVPPVPPRDVAINARVQDTSRAIVVIIDDNAIVPADIVRTKRILAKLLEGITPDDQAAVTYVRHSDLSQDFTNDVGQLITAVNGLRAALGFGGPASDLLAVVNNARSVLESATQPRKFIVYVGESAPGLNPIWTDALEKLRRSGVPIYPIDPVALEVYMPREASVTSASRGLVPSHYAMPKGFDVLAQFSGGHVFLHPGDPVMTASELMAENGSYYLLGYYPDPFIRDGKFHSVTVSVDRPGVHVRAREGYWALDQAALDAAHSMSAALGAGLDKADLPIALLAAPVSPTAKGVETVITTTVTYPKSASAPFDDTLDVGLVAVDPDAAVKARHEFTVPVHRPPAGSGPFSIVIDDALDLPAGALTVRVAVTSSVAHATGTAHLKVDVPELDRQGPELSGVIISASAERIEPAWGSDVTRRLIPFQPTTRRTFTLGDQLRIFARAYWRPPGPQGTGAEAVVRILDAETSRIEPLTGSPVGPDRVGATLDTVVPLTGLTPGTHVLQVEVRLLDRTPAKRFVVFDIR